MATLVNYTCKSFVKLTPKLQSLRECLLNRRWHDIEFEEYLPMRSELRAIGKLVLRETRIVVPKERRSHGLVST